MKVLLMTRCCLLVVVPQRNGSSAGEPQSLLADPVDKKDHLDLQMSSRSRKALSRCDTDPTRTYCQTGDIFGSR